MPDVAAAPVAAPAPAAPSAPAATPAAPSVPATPDAQPAAPAAPPAAEPGSGEGQQDPAAPAAPAGPKEPNQDDFPGDIEAFLREHNAWERGEAPAEVKPAEGETKPPEGAEAEAKPEEKPAEPAAAEAATPEAISKFMQEDAGFKAAVEANPTIKNALFAMARNVARLEPLGKIFPNVEAAQFAEQAAGTMVEVRSGFLEAMDTGDVSNAYQRFAEEFVERDEKGEPLKDSSGAPVYGQDFQLLNDYIVDSYHDIEIKDLETALQANQFASDDAREHADMALQALKFIKEYKSGSGKADKPDLSSLDPKTREYYERKERELNEKEEALTGKKREQSAEERQNERQTFEQNVMRKVGASVGQRIDNWLGEQKKLGVYIPSYVLEAKDPKTGISVFAQNVLHQFEEATYGRRDSATGKVIGGVAHIKNQAKMLSRRPPSPEAEQARVDFGLRLVDEFMPAILDSEKRKIQNKARTDSEARASNQQNVNDVVSREPRGGNPPGAPQAMTQEKAMQQAYAEVDQKYPDLDRAGRLEKALQIKNRIMGTGY